MKGNPQAVNKIAELLLVVPLIFFIISLSGCTTVKTPSLPGEVWAPPKWDRSQKEADLAWKALKSRELPQNGEKITLTDVVIISLKNNPTAMEAIEKTKAAKAKLKQAESSWFPQVSIGAKGEIDKQHTNRKSDDIDHMAAGPSAKIEMLLLDFGGRASRAKEALYGLFSSSYQYNQTIQDLILNAELSYFNYFAAEATRDAREDDLNNAKTTWVSADSKMKAGLGTLVDVLQAKSTYDNALYTLEDSREKVKIAWADLATVMGVPADSRFSPEYPSTISPPDIPQEEISVLIDQALGERPDISALRASVKSKKASLDAANSDLLPTLNMGYSAEGNQYAYYGAEKNNPLNDKRADAQTGYISVNWDIFDGFNNYARKKEAEALYAAEMYDLSRAELKASADVWNKYYGYKTSLSKLTAARSYFESAKGSYELATESYSAGLKTILDVLQAQKQLADARSTLIAARFSVFTSLAKLAHATGRIGVPQGDQ